MDTLPRLLPIHGLVLLLQLQDPLARRLRQEGLHHALAVVPQLGHVLGRVLETLADAQRRRRLAGHR